MQLCGVDLDRRDAGPVALIVGAVAVVFGRALLAPGRLLTSPDSDIVAQYYPWRTHLEPAIAEGRLPLWSTAEFGGAPFLANSQIGTFLPVDRLLSALFPEAYAITLALFLSVVAAGVGTYLYTRHTGVSRVGALLAGLSFCLSMAVVARIYAGHYSIVVAVGLLPVAYLCTDHALDTDRVVPAVTAGVVLAGCALAGQVQYPYLFALALGGYAVVVLAGQAGETDGTLWQRVTAVGRRLLRVFVPMGLTAISLAAVQLLPTLYFSRHSTRTGGLSLAESSIYALSPYQLLQFLTPYAFGRPGGPFLDLGNFWEYAFHPGVVPLLLAGVALVYWREPRIRALVATGAAALVLALGGPAYGLFFQLPLADSFRIPGRFTLFVAFAVAVLAGHGYDRLRESPSRRAWLLPGAVVAGTVGLAGAVVIVEGTIRGTVVGSVAGLYPLLVRELWIAATVAVGGLAAAVVVAYGSAGERGRQVATVTLLLLTVGPLLAYGAPLVTSQPVETVYDEPQFAPDDLVYDTRATQTPNAYRSPTLREPTNLLAGPDSLGGYNPLRLARNERLLDRLARGDGSADEPILDAWGVTHVIGAVGTANGYTRVGTVDGAPVYRNTDALESAYVVAGDENRVVADDRLSTAQSLTVATPTPNRLTVTGELESGLVIVPQTYYPLWTASVDGEPVTPIATEAGLLAVPVGDETARVVVRYQSWPLRVGAGISSLGLVGVVVVVGRDREWWTRLR